MHYSLFEELFYQHVIENKTYPLKQGTVDVVLGKGVPQHPHLVGVALQTMPYYSFCILQTSFLEMIKELHVRSHNGNFELWWHLMPSAISTVSVL